MKAKEVYKEAYKKGTTPTKAEVLKFASLMTSAELINSGHMDDGSQFVTVKIFVK